MVSVFILKIKSFGCREISCLKIEIFSSGKITVPFYTCPGIREHNSSPWFMIPVKSSYYMACNTQIGTFGHLRRVPLQINLRSPCRLIWNDIFLFMYFFFFCLEPVFLSTKSNGVVKCRLESACAYCAGWSETTLYANVRMSFFACCNPFSIYFFFRNDWILR